MPKLKREEAGFLSKSERQKLQRLYTEGCAAYGSVSNLVKVSNLSVSKVRQFLHSKPSFTKFNPATGKFQRVKAFAGIKNEIGCMDMAYVDKLAKDNNGVKYLLFRQDLFGRTVDAKGMKTKDSKETVRAFLSMITKKNRPQKNWVDKELEIAGVFKKLCKAEGKQIYSTMSETKAAFAERTIRSLKNILYRYMENNGYKYIYKLTQFVTTLDSRRNCSIDLIPRNVENSDFFSILYLKSLRGFRKPNLKLGTEFAYRSMTYPSERVISHSLHEKFSELLQFLPENLEHTHERKNKMRLSAVNFIRKSCSKSFNNGNIHNRVGFKCICATISRQNTELPYKLFTRATDSGKSMGGCTFGNILPINVPKYHGGKIYVF